MEVPKEKTDDNNNKNNNTPEETRRRFHTMTEEKYYEWLEGCTFIDAFLKDRHPSLTAAQIAAVKEYLNGGIRKKKKRLVSAMKQKNKVATSKKTDDNNNNNINTPSTEDMGRRFDTMPLEEMMKYHGFTFKGCTFKDGSRTVCHGLLTAAEKAAIKGDRNGEIRKKKKRLVSARKQKNKVATSKKTKKV